MFFKRKYTIRFISIPHYDNVYGFTEIPSNELSTAISNFCEQNNITIIKSFFPRFTDSNIVDINNHSVKVHSSSFVQIHGTKNDFLLLYIFLLNYEEEGYITLLTIKH